MKCSEPFDYFEPRSIREASRILKDSGPGGHILVGGTDLVIAVKEKGLTPRYLVDLKKIPGLSEVSEEADGGIRIGALTTMRELETSPVLLKRYPFLAQSAAEVGSIQIRNRATIGGNIANASPSADLAPSLLVLEGKVTIASSDSTRNVEIENFFLGPGRTVLKNDELLTEILLPPNDPRLIGDYIKFSPREMMDLPYVGVAVSLILNGVEKRLEKVRIALGAVSPVPMRARKAEALLEKQTLNEKIAEQAADEASRECRPITDVRASAEYRQAMVRAMTKRALLNLAGHRPRPASWVERREKRYGE